MIEMDERRCWDRSRNIVLIGPGGAGKSSLGLELAPLLDLDLIDLDTEFGRRIGNIGTFIRDVGYAPYKRRNSVLAGEIMSDAIAPTLLVSSSGFLTADNPSEALTANRQLLASCYSICLLPSRDFEKSVGIIVERQSRRSFARDRISEEGTIRARYPEYVEEGDMRLFSTATARETAMAVAYHLAGGV